MLAYFSCHLPLRHKRVLLPLFVFAHLGSYAHRVLYQTSSTKKKEITCLCLINSIYYQKMHMSAVQLLPPRLLPHRWKVMQIRTFDASAFLCWSSSPHSGGLPPGWLGPADAPSVAVLVSSLCPSAAHKEHVNLFARQVRVSLALCLRRERSQLLCL